MMIEVEEADEDEVVDEVKESDGEEGVESRWRRRRIKERSSGAQMLAVKHWKHRPPSMSPPKPSFSLTFPPL